VLVSHQSPVWIARLALEHRRLWHDPRKRQCSLASLTSLTYDDDRLVALAYEEPACRAAARGEQGAGA
jgi:broad specificity phosphatase PhoE